MATSWEYLIVDCKQCDRGCWHPFKVNGDDLDDFTRIGFVPFMQQVGSDGWELVNVGERDDREFLYFKRPGGLAPARKLV